MAIFEIKLNNLVSRDKSPKSLINMSRRMTLNVLKLKSYYLLNNIGLFIFIYQKRYRYFTMESDCCATCINKNCAVKKIVYFLGSVFLMCF